MTWYQVVQELLDDLNPREAEVIRRCFGIDLPSEQTLEEIGQQFDVTRERIRQIEAKALKRLAHPSRAELLRDFSLPGWLDRHASIPPCPTEASAMLEALRGLGYSTATALADLIDNSIAARAETVHLRFLWAGPASAIHILDDGEGYGHRRIGPGHAAG